MRSFSRTAVLFLLFAGFPACGGGGGSSQTGSFQVLSTSLFPGQTWPINGPIEIRFNKPVDLSTVNFSTIAILPSPSANLLAPVAGPAQGIFFAKSGGTGDTILFQPTCPTDAENLTGGLMPGNLFGPVIYTLSIVGGSGNPDPVVRAQDGSKLGNSYAVSFQTPTVGHPFFDPVPSNPPKPAHPDAFPPTLGLNLAIDPNEPLVLALDQPVQASSVDEGTVRFEFTHPQTGEITPIPTEITLVSNCDESGQATILAVPLGVFPPGETVRAYLSKNLEGLGESDKHPEDYLLFAAVVQPVFGSPQLDAFLEEFDDAAQADAEIADPLPLASWQGGRLEAAPLFPAADNGLEIEIGPGTQNGNNVVFSTASGTLKDKNGTTVHFADGLIECSTFTVKSPIGSGLSNLSGTGPNLLRIRAYQSITIEEGASIRVDGQRAADVSGIGTPNLPAVGGAGSCSGGSGGAGSPFTDQSDPKGGNGNGPFEVPNGGGQGGHSGYGNPQGGFGKNRPGGGGGGNWGVLERDASGNDVAFCYFPSACTVAGCPQPLGACGSALVNCKIGIYPVPNTQGEDGAFGVITALDSFTGSPPAQGGSRGPAVFEDANPHNNFLGRKPQSDGGNLLGELPSLQGGQGAGGGGDGVGGTTFPGNNFLQNDSKGGGAGGGAGALVLQSLGTILIRGTISADGGGGGEGEQQVPNSIDAGGGGGGAGGMIVIQSSTKVVFGLNASVSARGGQRGMGGGAHPYTVGSCPSGNECINNCAASRGGAGGKGVVQVHVPFEGSTTISCGGAMQRKILPGALAVETDLAGTQQFVLCERDSAFTAKFAPNNPHVLVPEFGTKSAARSQWYSTGWASVVGAPAFSFEGADGTGLLDGGVETVLASGSQAIALSEHAAQISSAALADAFRSAPKTLLRDGFRAGPGGTLFPIVSASIVGNEVTIGTDPSQGPLPAISSWQIVRRSFQGLSGGVASGFPDGSQVRVLFEGADELLPGSNEPDLSPSSLLGPTADLGSLLGKKLLRYTVTFDRGPTESAPGLGFLKIGVSF